MSLRRLVRHVIPGRAAAPPPVTPRAGSAPAQEGPGSRRSVLATDAEFVEAAYWLLLGREADARRGAELTRYLELGQPRGAILLTLMGPMEFRLRYRDVMEREHAPDRDDAVETGLLTLGTHAAFVEACYACILGREADAGGRATYVSLLEGGSPRHAVAGALLRSEEFARRYRELCPAGGVIPRDVQLCELANPAKWDNPEWLQVLAELQVCPVEKLAMHRKAYEFAQTAWGLRRLGALRADATILSVGAGHEAIAYALANAAGRVVATDLYGGTWQTAAAAEGDVRVLTHPEEFAPFTYRRDRLRFLQMDGRHLAFRDGTFDVAYSLSSIEHFGGWRGARRAVEEMARVTKSGGVVVVATEWCVSGPARDEVFQPDEVRALVEVPGVALVEPIDERVWARHEGAAVDLRRNPYETPHMLVRIDETVFTSVVLFLRKH